MHRSSTLSAMFSALLIALLTAACASSGSLVTGTAAEVRFYEYRSGTQMTIVNEKHTDRVALYSEEREDASIKVATNEVMDALLERVRDVKFGEFAREGSAPTSSTEWSQAMEVRTAKGTIHMLVRADIAPDAAAAFRHSRDAFVAIYNNIYAAQAVKTDHGKPVFQQTPARPEN